jgi:NADH:ubiquinone oxidoreductase subunit F (NADH-binding)/(2Fe-2S) ferredoxin
MDKRLTGIKDLEELRDSINASKREMDYTIIGCSGTGCQASDSLSVWDSLKKNLKKQGLSEKVALRQTGCHGFCEQGPLLIIEPGNILYCKVKPEDTERIVSETIGKGQIIEERLYTDPVTGKRITEERDITFYKSQTREILAQNKKINPREIEDYIAIGGYSALAKVLSSMKPKDVIEEIKRSGLRGRGGGGFPTGRKWESCRNAKGEPKYVICNADEGDPGAYMDRSVLEGNPQCIIEGMLIGAYAIGARYGFIYVRNEYPLALQNTKIALKQATELGLLGDRILGTDLSFDIRIARGGGAFVCGESTALMASLEGKVGEPRSKIIHTVERGYKDKPSNLNNVETWANVPHIINRGSSWFAGVGTERSKGTKIFALTGKVKNTGLVEVAMGTTLREIVYDIGGGALDGSAVKAVQTGGPSGGCIPESMFDLPVDFEALTKVGSMMGSGGLVVLDEQSCMVDMAKYFLNFILDESCGKCSVCRIGTSRMLEILNDITEGRGTLKQLELLEETAQTVSIASLCALGKTAPNPVLSTLKYFKDEYIAHIDEKRCPARVCRSLIQLRIDPEKCTGCGLCAKVCPTRAIKGQTKQPYQIDPEVCTRCRICLESCRFDAILVA